jgi:hypothetical protein
MKLIKRAAWILAFTCGVTVLLVVGLYLCGGPPLFINLVNRPATEPTAEEYAVYSNFIDDLFFSNQPFHQDQRISLRSVVAIVNRTSSTDGFHPPPHMLPMSVSSFFSSRLLGVDAFGPGHDFDLQNARSWQLQPQFHSRMKWILVQPGAMVVASGSGLEKLGKKEDLWQWLPHPSPQGPFPEKPEVCGVLELSRVGLDWRRRIAILDYGYRCGALCGQTGGDVVLHKTGKTWHVTSWGNGLIF